MSTDTIPEATKKSPRRKIWITIAAVATVAAIGIPAAAFAYNGYQTQQTTTAAENAYLAAQKAYIQAADVTAMLGARDQNKDVLDAYQAAAAAVQSHPALFSPESIKAIKADTDKYAALMKASYTPAADKTKAGTWKLELPTGVPFSKKQVVAKYLESDKARTSTWDTLNASITTNGAILEKNLEVEKTQRALMNAFGADLQAAAASAPKLKDAYVATVPKGSADAQAALSKALAGLQQKGSTVTKQEIDAFKGYTDAADALKASHNQAVAAEQAAAQVQAAADEAARQAAGGGSSDEGGTSDGGWSDSGGSDESSGGWSGGSTGGGSTGGGSTGGGSTGGGGSTPSYPRGSIVYTGSCSSASGSASANWTSNLVAPSDAVSVWVSFENAGSSWGIAWSCVDF